MYTFKVVVHSGKVNQRSATRGSLPNSLQIARVPPSHHLPHLEPLPLLRHIRFFKILRVLVAQLEVYILHRLVNALLAAHANDGTHALLDAPRRSYTRHANAMFLRDLLDALDDLLVGYEFAVVDEHVGELVGFGAFGGAVGEGACEGAACDGRPGDEADACVLTVGDLADVLVVS